MKKQTFQNLAQKINPSSFTDYRVYLSQVYATVKASQKSYSYIKFTEQLGLGRCNALYLIIKGNRPLTVKNARKIATAIGLKDNERGYFIKLVEYQRTGSSRERSEAFSKLLQSKSQLLTSKISKERLAFFSQWYHGAVFELLGFEDAKDDPVWLGKQLKPNVTPSKIGETLELLESLQLVCFDESRNRLFPTENQISTGSEIRGMVFKTYHNQMIDLGQRALGSEQGSNRDVSGVTISVSEASLEEVKRLTAEFRRKLLDLAESEENKEQILQVNIQAFPLTEVQKKK